MHGTVSPSLHPASCSPSPPRTRSRARRPAAGAGTCAPISFSRAPCCADNADRGTVAFLLVLFDRWSSCSHHTRRCIFFRAPMSCSRSVEGDGERRARRLHRPPHTACTVYPAPQITRKGLSTIYVSKIARASRSAMHLVVPRYRPRPCRTLNPLASFARLRA